MWIAAVTFFSFPHILIEISVLAVLCIPIFIWGPKIEKFFKKWQDKDE